jgi:hypothetical protein
MAVDGLDLLAGGLAGWGSNWSRWLLEGDGVVGDDQGGGGDCFWTVLRSGSRFEFGAELVVQKGVLAQLHFLIDPASRRWYTLDLRPESSTAALSYADNGPKGAGLTTLRAAPVDLRLGFPCEARVEVRDGTLRGWAGGVDLGEVAGLKIDSGPVGFGIFNTRCTFRSPRLRL